MEDDHHKLDRSGQAALLQLHSGYNRLNAHMHKILNLVPSAHYNCVTKEQTECVLQLCLVYTNIRTQMCGQLGQLYNKNCMGSKTTL